MRILILCHQNPYPADNGAKMRTLNLARQLTRHHQIALVCPGEPASGAPELERLLGPAAQVIATPWPPPSGWRSAGGLLAPLPRDVRRVAENGPATQAIDRAVQNWAPDLVLASDPVLGEYMRRYPQAGRVVDIAADYALYIRRLLPRLPAAARPLWWVRLLKWTVYTRSLAAAVDMWVVTAPYDAASLRAQLPPGARVAVVPNGVDLEANRYGPNLDAPAQIAHCGALSYEPNRDAMEHFCRGAWPIVRRRRPDLQLLVTGHADAATATVRSAPGVTLTGYVPSVRAVLSDCRATIVPLRIGVGTRLKILEAMAVGVPVVATSLGAEGTDVTDGVNILLADTPAEFADRVVEVVGSRQLRADLSTGGRMLVEHRYAWDVIGGELRSAIDGLYAERQASRIVTRLETA